MCSLKKYLSLDKKCPTLNPLRASRQNRLKCILGTELFEKKIDVRYYTHYTDGIGLGSATI